MSDLSRKTLQAITKRHIRPVPFWLEWVKNSAYWVGGILVVVVAAFVMGISWHALLEIDWEAYLKGDFSWWQIILSGVPLFSFFLLAVFLWVSVVLLQQTKRGYRHSTSFLLSVFFVVSVVSGYLIEQSPIDEPSERFLLSALPHTSESPIIFLPSAERQWSQPQRGLLGGTVVSIGMDDLGTKRLKLRDEQDQLWQIEYDQETLLLGEIWTEGDRVKMIGEQKGEGVFSAVEIRFWEKGKKKEPIKELLPEKQDEEETDPSKESLKNDVPQLFSARLLNVPFTVQAPYDEWSDPLFQDGCEEASLIMAVAWVNGTTVTQAEVKKEIQNLSAFEVKHFGQAVDTSMVDTAWLLHTYFGITTSALRRGVSIDDIKRAVAEGNIVIVPTDGRVLTNPHFKQPGPTRHMVVVIGYDTTTKEFIVNDPGTRWGEGYRYREAVLFDALLDYPTGDHMPVTSADKVMLIIAQD